MRPGNTEASLVAAARVGGRVLGVRACSRGMPHEGAHGALASGVCGVLHTRSAVGVQPRGARLVCGILCRADTRAGPGVACDRKRRARAAVGPDRLGQDAGGVPMGDRPAPRLAPRARWGWPWGCRVGCPRWSAPRARGGRSWRCCVGWPSGSAPRARVGRPNRRRVEPSKQGAPRARGGRPNRRCVGPSKQGAPRARGGRRCARRVRVAAEGPVV